MHTELEKMKDQMMSAAERTKKEIDKINPHPESHTSYKLRKILRLQTEMWHSLNNAQVAMEKIWELD